MAGSGTVEVRPVVSPGEWVDVVRQAGVDVPDEAVDDLAASTTRPRQRSRARFAKSGRSCWPR
jgi:hypothetical protein